MKNDINRFARFVPRHFFGRNINDAYNTHKPLRQVKSLGSMTLAIIPFQQPKPNKDAGNSTEKLGMGGVTLGGIDKNIIKVDEMMDPFSLLLKMGMMKHSDVFGARNTDISSATVREQFKIDPKKEYTEVELNIEGLDDLIKLGKSFNDSHNYPFDLKKLHALVPTLEKLQDMIGMENVKKSIVNQIVYFLAAIEDNDNMLHTAITGPPGVGKTVLGKIIGEIYYNMGIIKGSTINGKKYTDPVTGNTLNFIFKVAKRADLIGEYLGHTAMKTQRVIDECQGGVLFIDEAYSLGSGNVDRKDSYAKECIDTLNQNLTEKKKNFVCIIAGYPEELEKCFFSQNEGLRRRFPFRYDIEKYNPRQLGDILISMVKASSWQINEDTDVNTIYDFMKEHYEQFPYFGGDIENLIFHVKIAHAHRVIGLNPSKRMKISLTDINKGFDNFLNSTMVKDKDDFYKHLYT